VDEALHVWCGKWLGSYPIEVLFKREHLSRVTGVMLKDGRRVVVKARRDAAALGGCADVHRRVWKAGFPVAEPLVGPEPFGDGSLVANAETLVEAGQVIDPSRARSAEASSRLLSELIALAPRPGEIRTLTPAPPWTAWDHCCDGVWPPADDGPEDLDAPEHASWLDGLAMAIRRRLAEHQAPLVVGHGDWEAQNLRWNGLQPVVVHDWDSAIAAPVEVIVGLAAAVWPAGYDRMTWHATVRQTAAFLDGYQSATSTWEPDALEAAWAAGLWVRAFNAKKFAIRGVVTLEVDEAVDRAARAGLDWRP
jgi:hypothetical protein